MTPEEFKKFKVLTPKEVTAMKEDERETYAASLEEYRTMKQEEAIQSAVNKAEAKLRLVISTEARKDAITAIAAKLREEGITKEQVDEILEQIAKLRDDRYIHSTAVLSTGKAGKLANFLPALEKAMAKASESFLQMKQGTWGKGKELEIELKAAINVLDSAVANQGGVTTPDLLIAQDMTDWAEDVRPEAYITKYITLGVTNKAAMPYMDKLPNEGTMEITPEGTLKPLISVSFKLNYSLAIKIAGRTKLSQEAMDDLPFIMSVIQNELQYEHSIAEQVAIFTKINAVAAAFVAGDMAGSTQAPSKWDAVRAAIYGVKIASNGRFIPNAVLVPSADVYAMGATKDKNNNYVLPTFVDKDGMKISGVQIVEINDDTVAAGSFVVGDFRKIRKNMYQGFTIRIGQGINVDEDENIQSDFESNMYTIIGESRQHIWCYKNEEVAFIKATFAEVQEAIEEIPFV